MQDWLKYEQELKARGYQIVCGIDEAGRGPLAGPVCAACVVLPEEYIPEGVNDSKKLTEKMRDALYDIIRRDAVSYGIAMASHQEIDACNILQATFLAMRRAFEQLRPVPDAAIIDGNQKPGVPAHEFTLVKGDALSASVAAASILAKVTRDRLMLELDARYPEYGFAKHKGYGTAAHREALLKYGPCPEHRRSFLKKILGDAAG